MTSTIPDRQLPRLPGPAHRRANSALIGFNATTPDHAAFDWNAGFRVDAHIWLRTWRPSLTHWITSQGETSFGLDLAFTLSLHANGTFRTAITANGTTLVGPETTEPVPWTGERETWVRVDCVPSVSSFAHYLSDDGRNWGQLGVTTTAVPVTVFATTAVLTVPGFVATIDQITYESRYFVNNVLVANPRFDTLRPGTTSFVDTNQGLGKTWTVNPAGVIGVP